jgi:hypothetical protein
MKWKAMFAARKFMQSMPEKEFVWYLEQFPDVLRETLHPIPKDSAFVTGGQILHTMYVVYSYAPEHFVGKSENGLTKKEAMVVLNKYSVLLERRLYVKALQGDVFSKVCHQYEELLMGRGVSKKLAHKVASDLVTELVNEVFCHIISDFRNRRRCSSLPL